MGYFMLGCENGLAHITAFSMFQNNSDLVVFNLYNSNWYKYFIQEFSVKPLCSDRSGVECVTFRWLMTVPECDLSHGETPFMLLWIIRQTARIDDGGVKSERNFKAAVPRDFPSSAANDPQSTARKKESKAFLLTLEPTWVTPGIAIDARAALHSIHTFFFFYFSFLL